MPSAPVLALAQLRGQLKTNPQLRILTEANIAAWRQDCTADPGAAAFLEDQVWLPRALTDGAAAPFAAPLAPLRLSVWRLLHEGVGASDVHFDGRSFSIGVEDTSTAAFQENIGQLMAKELGWDALAPAIAVDLFHTYFTIEVQPAYVWLRGIEPDAALTSSAGALPVFSDDVGRVAAARLFCCRLTAPSANPELVSMLPIPAATFNLLTRHRIEYFDEASDAFFAAWLQDDADTEGGFLVQPALRQAALDAATEFKRDALAARTHLLPLPNLLSAWQEVAHDPASPAAHDCASKALLLAITCYYASYGDPEHGNTHVARALVAWHCGDSREAAMHLCVVRALHGTPQAADVNMPWLSEWCSRVDREMPAGDRISDADTAAMVQHHPSHYLLKRYIASTPWNSQVLSRVTRGLNAIASQTQDTSPLGLLLEALRLRERKNKHVFEVLAQLLETHVHRDVADVLQPILQDLLPRVITAHAHSQRLALAWVEQLPADKRGYVYLLRGLNTPQALLTHQQVVLKHAATFAGRRVSQDKVTVQIIDVAAKLAAQQPEAACKLLESALTPALGDKALPLLPWTEFFAEQYPTHVTKTLLVHWLKRLPLTQHFLASYTRTLWDESELAAHLARKIIGTCPSAKDAAQGADADPHAMLANILWCTQQDQTVEAANLLNNHSKQLIGHVPAATLMHCATNLFTPQEKTLFGIIWTEIEPGAPEAWRLVCAAERSEWPDSLVRDRATAGAALFLFIARTWWPLAEQALAHAEAVLQPSQYVEFVNLWGDVARDEAFPYACRTAAVRCGIKAQDSDEVVGKAVYSVVFGIETPDKDLRLAHLNAYMAVTECEVKNYQQAVTVGLPAAKVLGPPFQRGQLGSRLANDYEKLLVTLYIATKSLGTQDELLNLLEPVFEHDVASAAQIFLALLSIRHSEASRVRKAVTYLCNSADHVGMSQLTADDYDELLLFLSKLQPDDASVPVVKALLIKADWARAWRAAILQDSQLAAPMATKLLTSLNRPSEDDLLFEHIGMMAQVAMAVAPAHQKACATTLGTLLSNRKVGFTTETLLMSPEAMTALLTHLKMWIRALAPAERQSLECIRNLKACAEKITLQAPKLQPVLMANPLGA